MAAWVPTSRKRKPKRLVNFTGELGQLRDISYFERDGQRYMRATARVQVPGAAEWIDLPVEVKARG